MSFSPLPELSVYDCLSVSDCLIRIHNQFFWNDLEGRELLAPSNYWESIIRPRIQENTKSSSKSEVIVGKEEFKVFLNVSQFEPEELEVKINDNIVVVHGKHEEKCDAHGFICREFTRKYMLPKDCEQEKLTSTLISNNVLVIEIPKVVPPVQPMSETEKILQKTGDKSDVIKESTLEISKKSHEMCKLLKEIYDKYEIAKKFRLSME